MEPVATQIQTPDSFKTIGSILNTASTAQNLQAGKQQIEQQGLALLKQRQENTERIATQQFMSQPDNWQTNGRIDLDKVNAALPKIAPLTGAATTQKLTELGTAQTGAENAKLAFTGQERSIVGSLYGIAGRSGLTPEQLMTEMDNLKSQYKDSPSMVNYIDNAKVGLKLMKPGDAFTKTLITQAQSLMSPDSQNAALSPQAGMINTGQTQQQVTTQPAVGGNPPSITPGPTVAQNTLSPGSLESIETDAAGAKHVISRSPQGTILSTRPLGSAPAGTQRASAGGGGGGGTPFFNPKPGQMEDINQAQKEVTAIRAQGDAVPQARNINAEILRLSKDTKTGPGTAAWRSMPGIGGIFGDNYQELGKFLEKNAIQNMTAMGGPPSDARLSAAAAANGSTHFNAGALQAVTKFNDATTTAMEKYRQGVDKAVGLSGSDYTKLAAFKAEWAKNMDVDVFRVENAIRDGDQDELQKIARELGPAKMKALAQKRKALEALK